MVARRDAADPNDTCDVLVVGAGPTGLTLAAELLRFGVSTRLVDASLDRTHESRALAVQPRSLEVLRRLGVTPELTKRGNPAVRLRMTAGGRVRHTQLFDIGAEDTAFPFLLFVSQAETEALLGEHLAAQGLTVGRGLTLESIREGAGGLVCSLRTTAGARRTVTARYVVGCDGAHSTVREQAGIDFAGGRYPQTFLLADLAADGLEPETVNAYLGPDGPLFFFPLGRPAPWRLITMRATTATGPVTLEELQAEIDRATGGSVRVHDPVWTSAFRVHHRSARQYRRGRILVAGDAAHVHSPAGAQGMNTGIQDAVNLGWKLALVCRGAPADALLDSYDAERRPVGEFVLRFTDRAFAVVTSPHPVVRAVRTHVVPRVLPWALRFRTGRRMAFRTVSQLGIHYRGSPLVQRGSRWSRGPRAGDRLPDAPVVRAGQKLWLQEALGAPAFHLLLCGPADRWDDAATDELLTLHGGLLKVQRLVPARSARPLTGGRPRGRVGNRSAATGCPPRCPSRRPARRARRLPRRTCRPRGSHGLPEPLALTRPPPARGAQW